ncbi:hypothetical protein EON82_10810 [bacterium]|nr:MAG: hypothetical protein EON82_10810 [bacterium]
MQLRPAPHQVTLVDESSTITNGKLTERSFTFDLAGRQARRVECGGVAISDDLTENGVKVSTLAVNAQQIAPNRVKLKLQKVLKHENGQGTTSTTSEYEIAGGASGIKKSATSELNPPGGKTSVLLRWVDSRTRQPKSLVVQF